LFCKEIILSNPLTLTAKTDPVKRYIELEELFSSVMIDKVYISAFPNKKIFSHYLSDIAWETEVWIADNPTHMIHFNGDKFLGAHK